MTAFYAAARNEKLQMTIVSPPDPGLLVEIRRRISATLKRLRLSPSQLSDEGNGQRSKYQSHFKPIERRA